MITETSLINKLQINKYLKQSVACVSDCLSVFIFATLGSYTEHSEWKMHDAYLERNVIHYGCCPEPYPDVTVQLVLKRKPLFYVLNLLLPMIFIGLLTLLAFFLPAESGKLSKMIRFILLLYSVL